ncbi:hypothetical protein ABE073_02780 [Lederbergia citrisecunda]|uniref:P-loop ATPase, Sll1717 family n=1 Tax=Lederbergia citrisecunda TaxID=2833583 RepID=UPI003D2BA960
MRVKKAFYAYASQEKDVLQDIRSTIEAINQTNTVNITSWENLNIHGQFIYGKILEAIDKCDLFMCDLTTLNYNVLYELGYAIAKEKKIWISLNNVQRESEVNYRGLPISTVGYASYHNAQQLVDSFFSDMPHEQTSPIKLNPLRQDFDRSLVYLQCEYNTSASSKVTSILDKSIISIKRDDPYEGSQPLNWYLDILSSATGVIIHFHNQNSEKEKPLIAARKALIAGISRGLDLEMLILAHAPYQPPIDYHDDIKIHSSVQQCEAQLKDWLEPIVSSQSEKQEKFRGFKSDQKALNVLSNLIIGDYVAENESQDLIEYFLETAEYMEALKSQQILFVGRKGTGKTANLIKLKNAFSKDKRNFTISIQPQGHEFEGVLNILNDLASTSEKGHLIESIWKYLIYTEIAKEYYYYLESQPLHIGRSEEEDSFMDFVIQNERYINADFTLRLENIIQRLKSLSKSDSIEDQRLKVSEFLHDAMINQLRVYLGHVLYKNEKVTILIDNLDKSWSDNAELKQLSKLLFGLLNIVNKIKDEFNKQNYKQEKVNLSLIVFLRSDIFNRIMSYASERDKIPFMYLTWNEPRLLLRVIENRVKYSKTGVSSPDDLWQNFFCRTVNGKPLTTFIEELILPRPRDIVFLFKTALSEAINQGHTRVEEEDFQRAEYLYSEYALHSLLPENGGRIENLDYVLYQFAGEKSVLTYEELVSCLSTASEQPVDYLIKILCEMTFLGQEVQNGKFEYYSEKRPPQIIDKLAEKLAARKLSTKLYQINSAFHSYLEIERTEVAQLPK